MRAGGRKERSCCGPHVPNTTRGPETDMTTYELPEDYQGPRLWILDSPQRPTLPSADWAPVSGPGSRLWAAGRFEDSTDAMVCSGGAQGQVLIVEHLRLPDRASTSGTTAWAYSVPIDGLELVPIILEQISRADHLATVLTSAAAERVISDAEEEERWLASQPERPVTGW